jgi:hypothetical protein
VVNVITILVRLIAWAPQPIRIDERAGQFDEWAGAAQELVL